MAAKKKPSQKSQDHYVYIAEGVEEAEVIVTPDGTAYVTQADVTGFRMVVKNSGITDLEGAIDLVYEIRGIIEAVRAGTSRVDFIVPRTDMKTLSSGDDHWALHVRYGGTASDDQ
ncbi:MAG: hypothetical protein ACHREM_13640 [Polyangiales bacterium]